jgi:hypothetical protein
MVVAITLLLYLLYFNPLQYHPHTNLRSTKYHEPSKLPLIPWLQERGFQPGKQVLFLAIGDSDYVRAMRNFQARLDAWGYAKHFVALCLDHGCANDTRLFNAFPGYIQEETNRMKAVAAIKVMITIEILAPTPNDANSL